MTEASKADQFCMNITAEEFKKTFDEMRSNRATMQQIADFFKISKYSLRRILKEKCKYELPPGHPTVELKFKGE